MRRYLFQRALGLLLSILIASFITFLIMHAVPGGPFDEDNQPLPPAAKHNLLVKYGLDQPLYQQYARFLWSAGHLDLGISYSSPTESVGELIARVWVPTLQLGALVLLAAFGLGLPLGIVAATHYRSWLDHLITFLTLLSFSIPGFILAVWLIFLLSIHWRLLPTGGWGEPNQIIMPLIVYTLGPLAVIARYTRTNLLEALHSDYIRTARAKGLREHAILLRHALRNTLVPMVTVLGPLIPNILTGTVLIEVVFRIPGLGRYFVTSSQNRDYPMIMALMLMVVVVWGFTYFLTDILYVLMDPMVRLGKPRQL